MKKDAGCSAYAEEASSSSRVAEVVKVTVKKLL